jgi:hypothetical protein
MAKKKAQIEMVSVAKLDEQNVFQGVEFIDRKALTAYHVEVPGDCDLKVGKYFWDKEKKTFMPTIDFLIEVRHAKRNTRGGK